MNTLTPLESIEQEIKRLNAQAHEPTSTDILAVLQMLVNALKDKS